MAFLGEESLRAAEASECAGEQGSFWQYHDILFDNWAGENQGAFSDPHLIAFADQAGRDDGQFRSCLETGRYRDRVKEDIEAAKDLGVRSTPTIFINQERVDGLSDYPTYRRIIEGELAKVQ